MPGIPIGTKGESTVSVTDANAISFLPDKEARVLATPWLIYQLEWVAHDAVQPYLLDGQDTVGTQVSVRHLAATPIGMDARCSAEVTAVEGRRVTFRVEAWDDRERIAEGTHERAIIDVDRFTERLRAKRNA